MSTSREERIAPIPFGLGWLEAPQDWGLHAGGLTITAGPRTDWFVDPNGCQSQVNAPALLGHPEGDFQLSARVEVSFASIYDAGVLALWEDDRTWAKLCFEYSPQREPMVVSVVTRELSDDCNSLMIAGDAVWLRIARIGRAYAFHASVDGAWWQFVRYFAVAEGANLRVGFEAQSPLGPACTARFDEIAFSSATLAELRDGS